eukprot:4798164-Pyramimonas_sp.AAC.1
MGSVPRVQRKALSGSTPSCRGSNLGVGLDDQHVRPISGRGRVLRAFRSAVSCRRSCVCIPA